MKETRQKIEKKMEENEARQTKTAENEKFERRNWIKSEKEVLKGTLETDLQKTGNKIWKKRRKRGWKTSGKKLENRIKLKEKMRKKMTRN